MIMKKLKRLFIKVSRKLCFEENIGIQQIENGFVFNNKYYKTFDDLMPDLAKEIKNHFKK